MTTHGDTIIDASGLFNNKRTDQYTFNKLKIYMENLNLTHHKLNEILSSLENFQDKLQDCQISLNETKKENDYTMELIERIEGGDQEAIIEAEEFIKLKMKNH